MYMCVCMCAYVWVGGWVSGVCVCGCVGGCVWMCVCLYVHVLSGCPLCVEHSVQLKRHGTYKPDPRSLRVS